LKNLIRKIKGLEKISSRLNPGLREREAMLEQVRDYAETFLQQLPDKKTYIRDERINGFRDSPIQETAAELSDLLEFYHREVDTTGILPASGGQLGYIPGGGLYPSALGDYLADISNRYSGVAFAGPGAARMELALVEWMRRLVGYPDTAAGDLTSGGSIATLSALVTARDACGIEDSQIARSCIYLTAQAHHCISKALHVAGLKNIRQRIVGMDQRFRMDSEALQGMIDDDRARNLKPWAIVASAGTTDTGAVDPIREIAAIASKNKLWFHLDAAYGGFFLLCAEGREPLDGLDLADSVVMDPHKGLGIPYGTGAVLVREGHLLAESNRYYADYMQDAKRPGRDADGEFSPADYSLELTRPFESAAFRALPPDLTPTCRS
jgi:glutamate/tyrosine decarboxylase-like PLP-dependent enzyme